jgi:predicted RNA-binding Zn ribbon-like protein
VDSITTEHTLTAGNVRLLGGVLCLDFANTANWHKSDQPVELLVEYADLVGWAGHTNIVNDDEAATLLRQAAYRPAEAEAVRQRAVALREAIYRIFVAIADTERPEVDDLELLNQELLPALSHARIVEADHGFTWDWADDRQTLDRMLWPVARSAAELLSSAQLNRARQCADDRCGWLFLDMSRNRSRRWCSMDECGNRNKARNYYRRQRNDD